MSNRKATFAKRQREMDLKDHAKAKESRRLERTTQTKTGKGPQIAWDEQVFPVTTPEDPDAPPPAHDPVPTDDSPTSGAPPAAKPSNPS